MEFLTEYWALIVALIAFIAATAVYIVDFKRLPKNEQLAKVKEWMLYAVTMAEKELGSGTGKLKLRYVYDLFLTKFSWLAKVISFEQFSELVDEALEEMKLLLNTNEQIAAIVENTEE